MNRERLGQLLNLHDQVKNLELALERVTGECGQDHLSRAVINYASSNVRVNLKTWASARKLIEADLEEQLAIAKAEFEAAS